MRARQTGEHALVLHDLALDYTGCTRIAVSVADEEWGERVGLVVELNPEETTADPRSLAELIKAIVRDELGVAATPREVRLVEKLPRLSSGKPDRLVCAALFVG
jgi:O-succinylbenzoic acid--CoA ligase